MTNQAPGDASHDIAAKIVDLFSPFPVVRAIALGGSRASSVDDTGSDFDFYIYTEAQVPLESRLALAAAHAGYSEVGNQTWGDGDEWVMSGTGEHVDLI